jgi:hypothetical protein
MGRRDLNIREKALQTDALPIRKPSIIAFTWHEGILSVGPKAKECQCNLDQWPRQIHGTRRDVDIDEHATDSRPHRLEISTPQFNPTAYVARFTGCEERPDIEWVSQIWCHSNHNVERLSKR